MEKTTYQTINVIPVTEIMPVIADLQRQIAALSDKLDNRPDESILRVNC